MPGKTASPLQTPRLLTNFAAGWGRAGAGEEGRKGRRHRQTDRQGVTGRGGGCRGCPRRPRGIETEKG